MMELSEVGKFDEYKLSEISKSMDLNSEKIENLDKPVAIDIEKIKGCPIEGNGGNWTGERGNSDWIPDKEFKPQNPDLNPDGLSWKQIGEKYGFEKISFNEGEPDFSEISKGNVEIDNFTDCRLGKGGNFDQACDKLSEITGYDKSEIKAWMKDNKYTWHECSDCRTMQKVPREIHGNIRHSGGISEFKARNMEG